MNKAGCFTPLKGRLQVFPEGISFPGTPGQHTTGIGVPTPESRHKNTAGLTGAVSALRGVSTPRMVRMDYQLLKANLFDHQVMKATPDYDRTRAETALYHILTVQVVLDTESGKMLSGVL